MRKPSGVMSTASWRARSRQRRVSGHLLADLLRPPARRPHAPSSPAPPAIRLSDVRVGLPGLRLVARRGLRRGRRAAGQLGRGTAGVDAILVGAARGRAGRRVAIVFLDVEAGLHVRVHHRHRATVRRHGAVVVRRVSAEDRPETGRRTRHLVGRAEIIRQAPPLLGRGGVQQPHQQEERHHRGDEIGIGDLPRAAVVAAFDHLLTPDSRSTPCRSPCLLPPPIDHPRDEPAACREVLNRRLRPPHHRVRRVTQVDEAGRPYQVVMLPAIARPLVAQPRQHEQAAVAAEAHRLDVRMARPRR